MLKTVFGKIKPLIKAMRLEEQSIVLVSYLYGWLDSHSFVKQQLNRLVYSGVGLVFLSVVSFLVNEYIDAKDTDQFRQDKQPMSTINSTSFVATVAIFGILGIIIAARQGFFWAGIIMLLAGIAYSWPPLRTKNRSLWDFFTLAFLFVIIPYLIPYRLSKASILSINWLGLLFFLLLALASNLLAIVRDIEPDRQANLTTTGTVLGYKKTLILGALALGASLFLAGVMLYQKIGWWYYPTIPFALATLCIVSFCAGSRFETKRIAFYCRKAIKVGVKITYLIIAYQLAALALI